MTTAMNSGMKSGTTEGATPGRLAGATHALHVVRAHMRVGVMNIVQYRVDFVVATVNAAVTVIAQLTGLAVIFDNTTTLNGWEPNEMLVLIGVHTLIGGLISMFVQPSMEAMMEGIRLGTFDFVLTKPVDAQVLASAQTVSPQAAVSVLVGLGVTVTGVVRAGAAVEPGSLVLFLPTLFAGLVIVYSFMLLLSTLAFWFVKLDNLLAIFQALFGNAGRWPVTIFPGWMRFGLTFVVPLAFAVTIPAQTLTGRASVSGALGAMGVAVLFLVAARGFWRVALRRYTGASA